MKKLSTIALIVSTISAFAFMSFTAPGYVPTSNTVKVSWLKESYDFGEIPQGKPVFVEFKFKNDGNEAIIISDVVTTCGCTASDYSKEPIAPGRSSTIRVSYNAAAKGTFSKSITVNFTDAGSKKVLTINGIVK